MIDWLELLNVGTALANCRADIYGDWYRDPWDWAELTWASSDGSDHLVQRLNADRTSRPALLDVPKENFIVRPAVVLDAIDRLAYEALVDRISPQLVRELPDWVYGWRLDRKDPRPGNYANRQYEWTRFASDLKNLSDQFQCALQTDIVSFFASIPIDPLCDRIQQLAGDDAVTKRLIAMLQSWSRIAGRSGLPQRCNPSSILANMYLMPIDDVIREFGHHDLAQQCVGRDVAALRWMDDIWIFGDDASRLRRAQMEMQSVLGELGLHISPSKTSLLEGDNLFEVVEGFEHSAVDQALSARPPEPRPLSDMIDELLSHPSTAPSTSIRFATVRMRAHQWFREALRFVDACPRMPQGSQWVGRLFRDSGYWRDLDGWFADYRASEWGRIDWAVAQMGTMFPTHWDGPTRPVVDVLSTAVDSLQSISMFALGSQRLATWNPDNARRLFRDTAKRAGDPHQRRVLALAALNAGEEIHWVRRVLSEFEENGTTAAFLSSRSFSPVRVSADFEADPDED